MDKLKALLAALPLIAVTLIGSFLPLMLIGGLILMLFDEPKQLLKITLFYAGLFAVIATVGKLATHPKTKIVVQPILYVLAIVYFVHSCHYTGSGCVSSRYIDC